MDGDNPDTATSSLQGGVRDGVGGGHAAGETGMVKVFADPPWAIIIPWRPKGWQRPPGYPHRGLGMGFSRTRNQPFRAISLDQLFFSGSDWVSVFSGGFSASLFSTSLPSGSSLEGVLGAGRCLRPRSSMSATAITTTATITPMRM